MHSFRQFFKESQPNNDMVSLQKLFIAKLLRRWDQRNQFLVPRRSAASPPDYVYDFYAQCGIEKGKPVSLSVTVCFVEVEHQTLPLTNILVIIRYYINQWASYRQYTQHFGNVDLSNPGQVDSIIGKFPKRFQVKKNQKHPAKFQYPVPFVSTSPIELSKFETEETPHNNAVWIYVQGWLKNNDAVQFQGQVEFRTDKQGNAIRVLDASPLDITHEGYEKVIINGLNLYLKQQKYI